MIGPSVSIMTKGNVDIKGGNYSKGLNKQDVNLTDRLLAIATSDDGLRATS